jgi:hypothetical protein
VSASGLLVAVLLWLAFSVVVGMPPWAVVGLVVAAATVAWGFNRIANRATTPGRRQAGVLAASSAAVVTVFGLIQLVPYGRDHTNPPVTGEPAWSTPETRDLMVRACYGCHSNEVVYPSYADIAPISWMVASHVSEGRAEVNYSEFATTTRGFDETIEVILDGSMPPSYYTRFGLHPEARLTDAEIAALVEGLRATPGFDEHEDRRGGHGEDD